LASITLFTYNVINYVKVLLGLYGCLLRAVRTGFPYGCQKFTLVDRKDRPYVRAGRTGAKNDARTYGPYVRSFLTARTYTGYVYRPLVTNNQSTFCRMLLSLLTYADCLSLTIINAAINVNVIILLYDLNGGHTVTKHINLKFQ